VCGLCDCVGLKCLLCLQAGRRGVLAAAVAAVARGRGEAAVEAHLLRKKNTQPDQETLALNLYHTELLSQELSLTYRIKGFSDLELRNLDFRISDS
jgi:hypothetical protein